MVDCPRPPAIGYHVMAAVLGDAYLSKPPPDEGVMLSVTCTDGIETLWAVPYLDSERLRVAATRDARVRRIMAKGYVSPTAGGDAGVV